jgi:hypothetical protein
LDFITLELSAKFSGLLPFTVAKQPLGLESVIPAHDAEEAARQAESLMRFVNSATKKAETQCNNFRTPFPLVDQEQLDCLLPGRVVAQNICDILLLFFCGLIGADFWDSDSSVIPGGNSWPSLNACLAPNDERLLVVSTKQAGTLSRFVKSDDFEALDDPAIRARQILIQYTASIWAFTDGEHSATVKMQHSKSDGEQMVMHCTMLDSMSGKSDTGQRESPIDLIQGLSRFFE